MDYEKLHKDTINRLQQMVSCGKITVEVARGICADFIPENEDERIRKDCLKYLDWEYHRCSHDEDKIKIEKCIAWLEKQGEQKLADKAEPKFKEGDWVVSPNGVYWHIDKISNNRYEVTSNTGESSNWNLDTNIYHRFTIQDAKDGDVLADNIGIILFRKIGNEKYANVVDYYCSVYTSGQFGIQKEICFWGYSKEEQLCPATKEQREKFFATMRDAGYEWDAEKKELKKIEQKPAWSEEDEKIYNLLYEEYENIAYYSHSREKAEDIPGEVLGWLKSLKDRVQPQQQEWSEEDERIIKQLTLLWSEVMIEPTCCRFGLHKDEIVDWLKSLKDKMQPQNIWKPSDLPHWKKSTLPNDNTTGFNSDYFCYKGYNINYKELFEKLPKDD